MRRRLVGFGLLLVGLASVLVDLVRKNIDTIRHALNELMDNLLAAVGIAGLIVGICVLWSARKSSQSRTQNDTKKGLGAHLLSDYGIAASACTMAFVGCCALVTMLQVAGNATSESERSKLQIESIKYGLGVAASGGAVAALLLAVRRQRLSESMHQLAIQTQVHTEADAAERRVTELYTKAVEQLGSPDAAVRLGGMYALERVAQTNIGQRQTVVNVLCAYLRMPYSPPDTLPPATPADEAKEAKEELEVRVGAQEILTKHLEIPGRTEPIRPEDLPGPSHESPFWPHLSINLAGAKLRNFRILAGYVETANFSGATFFGETSFNFTYFRSTSWWHDANFEGSAHFDGADFFVVRFDGKTVFNKTASFSNANFRGVAWFDRVKFRGEVDFEQATFRRREFGSPRMRSARALANPDGHALQQVWPDGWHLKDPEQNSNYGVLARTNTTVPQARAEIGAAPRPPDSL
ncbi:pentapeptide repeat-containing protein [Micromonospora sp. NPDC001898]|uniref:pentapeptide repeat-containing protein n=1 Tax=Micromonospora sp. NPDC001898 TaxID=3364221 RepID=UPI0036C3531C